MLSTLLLLAVTNQQEPPAPFGEHYQIVKMFPKEISFERLSDDSFIDNEFIMIRDANTGKRGLFGMERKDVLPVEFKEIQPLSKDLIVAKPFAEGSGWSLYNREGEIVASGTVSAETDWKKVVYTVNDERIIFQTADNEYATHSMQGEIISDNFVSLRRYTDNLVSAIKDNKLGLLDLEGNVVLPFEYTRFFYPNDNDELVAANDQSLFGVIKTDGTVVLPFTYASLSRIDDNYLIASKAENQSALIRIDGTAVTPFEFSAFSNISGGHISWQKTVENTSGITDVKTGKIIYNGGTAFLGFIALTDGLFEGVSNTQYEDAQKLTGLKRGLVHPTKGQISITEYTRIELLETKEGRVYVLKLPSYKNPEPSDILGNYILHGDDLMNEDGKLIAEKATYAAVQEVNGKSVITYSKDDLVHYIDYDGNELFTPKQIVGRKEFSEGLLNVRKDRKYGYINTQGTTIIDHKFDGSSAFKGGYAPAAIGEKWGLISKTGTFVIQPKFSMLFHVSDGFYFVRTEDSFSGPLGMVDQSGNYVLQPEFSEFNYHRDRDDLLKLKKANGAWGIFDRQGNEWFQPFGKEIEFVGNDHFIVYMPTSNEARTLFKLK